MGFTGPPLNVHETPTGQLYDMDLITSFCQENRILLVVDAISSFLADHYHMDGFRADVTIFEFTKRSGSSPGTFPRSCQPLHL